MGKLTMDAGRESGKAPPPVAVDGPAEKAKRAVQAQRAQRRAQARRLRKERLADEDAPVGGPRPERLQHGPVTRSKATIADVDGGIGQPHICADTLDVMERRGTITRKMHAAAAQFRVDFRQANMDTLGCIDMAGAGGRGGQGPTITESQQAARARVAKAMAVLGGRTSPAGSCVWAVVGEERTLKEWGVANGWRARPVSQEAASGVLVAALGALEAHYGY